MNEAPPQETERTAIKDREHLKILAILHFVGAGFGVLGTGFLALHYMLFRVFFLNPEMWEKSENPPNPEFIELFQTIFIWFYLAGALFFLSQAIMNILGGLYLLRQKHRIFCMVVAGMNCLQIPLGLILGIFTLVVLSRESVAELFDRIKQRLA